MTTTPRPLTAIGKLNGNGDPDDVDIAVAAFHGEAAYHRATGLELRVKALEDDRTELLARVAALEAQTRTLTRPWASVRQAGSNALPAARRAISRWLAHLAERISP